jgi:hypothetical protein
LFQGKNKKKEIKKMRVHIEHFATSYSITFHGTISYDVESFGSLDDALAFAEEEIDVRQQATFATIWDSNTGEVYATCAADSNTDDDVDWDYNEDEGYDPYLGEYTYDC